MGPLLALGLACGVGKIPNPLFYVVSLSSVRFDSLLSVQLHSLYCGGHSWIFFLYGCVIKEEMVRVSISLIFLNSDCGNCWSPITFWNPCIHRGGLVMNRGWMIMNGGEWLVLLRIPDTKCGDWSCLEGIWLMRDMEDIGWVIGFQVVAKACGTRTTKLVSWLRGMNSHFRKRSTEMVA